MSKPNPAPAQSVLQRLREDRPLATVELRPPRTGLSSNDTMELWIDMYHSIQRLSRHDTIIFLTDNAVGLSEEENLAHLTANLAGDVDPSRIVPFLTSKHSIEYCLMHASRAASNGFGALTVLGGDHTVGPPRCVPHARRAAFAHSPAGAPARPRRLGQPASSGGRAGGLPAGRAVRGRVLPDPGGVPPQHPCRGAAFSWRPAGGVSPTRVSSACFSIGAPTRHPGAAGGILPGAGRGAHPRVRGRIKSLRRSAQKRFARSGRSAPTRSI